ncbi:MAG: hypothetical protein GX130_04170 [Candidatus Hydrogenedens sp.]|nr:hypothetical protein [Candidatus Hydrogenedens sp.]
MSIKKALFISVLAFIALAFVAQPCVWEGSPTLFGSSETKDLYYLPDTHFDSEYLLITDQIPDLEAEEKYNEDERFWTRNQPTYLRRFVFARERVVWLELKELRIILADHPDRDAVIEDYESRRRLLNYHAIDRLNDAIHEEVPWLYRDEDDEPRPTQKEMQLIVENCPPEIPLEFSLNIRGAEAFFNRYFSKARDLFETILLLPPEERRHKTVWATFMSGRCSLELNELKRAEESFQSCWKLVEEGFADPLGLAAETFGWLGKIHLQRGDCLEALHAYMNYRAVPERWAMAKESLFILFRRVIKNQAALEQMAGDDLARQLMTAWLTSQAYKNPAYTDAWFDVTESLPEEGFLAGADRLAWLAYKTGQMDLAARWLKQSDERSVPARFVQSKLLLREGKLDEANRLLHALSEEISRDKLFYFEGDSPVITGGSIRLSEGAILLRQKDYIGAVKAFVPDSLEDAEFLARRMLTLEELETVINDLKALDPDEVAQTRKQEPFFKTVYYDGGRFEEGLYALQKIQGQRYARMKDWEKAAHYFQTLSETSSGSTYTDETAKETAEAAREIADLLKQAENRKGSERERAQTFFDAGVLIRRHGGELLGVWSLGSDCGLEVLSEDALTVLGDDAEERVEKTCDLCGRQCNLRFVASGLMRQAAELLPDNDPLTARALFNGGSYIKARYPKEADHFYKALVRRNPNLLIAKQADELRWFPENFTDEILYTPRPIDTSIRKRDLAILVVKGVVLLGVVLAVIWAVRRRNRE